MNVDGYDREFLPHDSFGVKLFRHNLPNDRLERRCRFPGRNKILYTSSGVWPMTW